MKRFLFTLSLFASASVLFAQAPDFAWARTIGNSGITSGCMLALDADGNSYVAGTFGTSLTVGGSTLVHPGPGGASVFLAKFDASGNGLWAKKIPVNGMQDATNPDKLVTDAEGNLYLTGTFRSGDVVDTITVPPLAQNRSYGLAKFDPDGNIRWLRMTNTPDLRIATSSAVAIDSRGHICLTGLFNTSLSFDSGETLTNTDNTQGVDAFVATYDTDGRLLRAKRLGVVNPLFDPNLNYPVEVFKLDRHDNLYRLTSATKTVVKYTADGTQVYSKTLSATGGQSDFNSMAVDAAGNVFLGGWFMYDALTLEGTLISKFGNANSMDALLVKLSATDRSLAWYKRYDYQYGDSYRQIRTDDLGNLYAVGKHTPIVGDSKGLLIKYTNTGALLWEQVIEPGPGGTNPPAATIEAQNLVQARNGGNILVAGWYKERIYFDAGTFFVNAPGVYKMFVAQYGVCNAPVPVLTASSENFCEGGSADLTASAGTNYVWSTGETGADIEVTVSGTYYVVSVQDEECYARSLPLTVTEHPFPDVSVSQDGATLSATETEAGYQWLNCNGMTPVSGAVNRTFIAPQNGQYAVALTNAAGCSDTSACFTVTGLAVEETAVPVWTLFPNPATDRVNLSGLPVQNIRIFDGLGREVLRVTNSSSADVSALAPGTYVLLASGSGKTLRKIFVKK